ncbi:MAG: HNH endonuclease [Xanthomonadales bacterium]|nr:HNH endonuclease [Xanthomonadales bacterium]
MSALPGLPKISAAFREGRVSYSKVRAMTRVATAANEDDDGSWVFKGRFTPEQGALIRKALDAALAQLFIEQKNIPDDVSAETSRRLGCDCAVVHWHENQNGELLNIGRKSRIIPPAIRRALHRRDGGCRFPGCTCTHYVDAHHIIHWADGGETSMENLVLLCRRHHRLVHEEGFAVQAGRLGLNITAKTPVPSWLGERMDYSIAVEGLLRRE